MTHSISDKAYALSTKIRCMTCAGQTIDASDTQIAQDMRSYITRRLEEGDTQERILSQLKDVYGPSILVEAPVQTNTLGLWVTPFLALMIIVFVAVRWQRKQGLKKKR